MEDINFIKQNATESGDCGNGWVGWRLGKTLYIEYTGKLDYFCGEAYVPDYLLEIACWDAAIKTETEILIIGNASYVGLSLGLGAFKGWSNLKRIDILTPHVHYGILDDSDPEADYYAFNSEDHFDALLGGIPNLEAVNILDDDDYMSEDGVIYDKERKMLRFCPCGKKGQVTIPDWVAEIEAYAFDGCGHLTNVTIPDSMKEISYWAFRQCVNLKLTVPDTVTKIGSDAFMDVPHIIYHGPAQSENNWGAKSRN